MDKWERYKAVAIYEGEECKFRIATDGTNIRIRSPYLYPIQLPIKDFQDIMRAFNDIGISSSETIISVIERNDNLMED